MGKQPLIVAFATLLVAGTAHAADPVRDSIDVSFQDCEADPIGESSFRQALGLELDQGLDQYPPRTSAEGSPPKIEVKFRCDGLALIRIQLENSNSQRRVRFSDVARTERARALALVVAELYRSGSQGQSSQSASDTAERSASDASFAPPAAGPPQPPAAAEPGTAPSAAPPRRARTPESSSPGGAADAGVDKPATQPQRGARPRIRGAATLRTALGETGTHYGGGLGLDFTVFRLAAEALFSRETRARGAISSGVGAVRVARGVPLLHSAGFGLEVMPSAALGVTWAVGQSEVVGSVVRDVLMPYGDVRLGLLSAMHVDAELDLELEIYAGRAAGILARADGEPTQATGGWFAGAEAGLSF